MKDNFHLNLYLDIENSDIFSQLLESESHLSSLKFDLLFCD